MLRKLASDTAWYGLSSILGRVINYLLVPLYTATLSLEANGLNNKLFAYVAFANVVLTFGMETAYFRFAGGTAEQEQAQARRGQALVATVVFGALALLALLWQPVVKTYFAEPQAGQLITLLAGLSVIDALSAIPLARLRRAGRPRVFAGYRLASIGFNVAFNVLFFLVLPGTGLGQALADRTGAGVQPVLYIYVAQLLANAVYLPLLLGQPLAPRLLAGPEGAAMVRYAWPIMLMGLAGIGTEMLGRLLLEAWLPAGFYPGLSNTEVLGIYGNCLKLAIFMSLVIQAFRLGAEPFFFKQGREASGPAAFARLMDAFVLACCGLLLAVSLNLDWLGPLFLRRPAYQQGLGVVPILLAANLWLGVYYNLSAWFKLTDKTHFGTLLSLGGLGLTIVLNLLLIPVLGYMGTAWATLVAYFFMAAASYALGRRHYPVPYRAGFLALLVGACLAAGVAVLPIRETYGVGISWVYRLGVVGVYGGVVVSQLKYLRVNTGRV